jgi:TetR/AcrR family transcriptional regulator, acrAB operon repressor
VSRTRSVKRTPQEQRSERSRGQILRAALKLFSSFGYHGTSMRDIAEEAGVSTGNVYHQFSDKEAIFRTLLDQYWEMLAQPDAPLNKALAEGAFPNDLEKLARAARDSVAKYRRYVSLVYVDVVEFDGTHIRRFYADMAGRFQAFLETDAGRAGLDQLRDGVSPLSAIMTASRFFLQYYSVELLFGVPNHFGVDDDTALQHTLDILKFGMFKHR